MTQVSLARSTRAGLPHDSKQQVSGNPFATPASCPLQLPEPACLSMPKPLRVHHPGLASSGSSVSRHDSLFPSQDSKSSSISSKGEAVVPSSVDPEKKALAKVPAKPARVQPAPIVSASTDPEKAMSDIVRTSQQSRRPALGTRPPGRVSLTYELDDDDDDADGLEQSTSSRKLQEQKAWKILLHLSGPCVLLSMLNAIWAFISLFITILTQPVRLCARRPSFGLQLSGLLGPTLNLQLRCIFTPLPPHANEDLSYHSGILMMVHLAAPFLSLGMMPMAWVVAVYWASSIVVGDPSGVDKRDDGLETVLGLRKWWENFLLRSVHQDGL